MTDLRVLLLIGFVTDESAVFVQLLRAVVVITGDQAHVDHVIKYDLGCPGKDAVSVKPLFLGAA